MLKSALFFLCLWFCIGEATAQQLGRLTFPNSGAEEAQPEFIRGMLLLHSFEYEDAAEAFQSAQKIDREFAMAYWGEAMTHNHPVWFIQDKVAGLHVLQKLAPTIATQIDKAKTDFEKDLLRAIHVLYGEGNKEQNDIDYADFLGQLYQKYPGNVEIASFYSLSLMGRSHDGRDKELYAKAGEIMEEAYKRYPDHPGVLHYLIHAYDDPFNAEKALGAAFRYSKVAPEAAHALHMPTHIFVAKGMWDEVVSSNIDSWKASESRRIRKNLSLQARGYHSFHWLQYGLLQKGEIEQARILLDSIYSDAKAFPSSRIRKHLSMMQATYIVEAKDWYGDVHEMGVDHTLLSVAVRAGNQFSKAYAAIQREDTTYARAIWRQMITDRLDDEPVKLDQDMTICHAVGGEFYDQMELDSKIAAIIEGELEALLLYQAGEVEKAFEVLDLITEAEMQLPLAYGPPEVVKPSFELYGDLLLEQNMPERAKLMYELALLRAPRRALSQSGLQKSLSML